MLASRNDQLFYEEGIISPNLIFYCPYLLMPAYDALIAFSVIILW